MKRTDRLRQLIRILRDGDVHRAVDIAEKTGVTVRTVYRDMETLMASGVPMVGSRGTGYRITAPITLPAMNLSMAELEALHPGLMAVAQSGEADLTEAAQTLADKLDAALPRTWIIRPRMGLPFTHSQGARRASFTCPPYGKRSVRGRNY